MNFLSTMFELHFAVLVKVVTQLCQSLVILTFRLKTDPQVRSHDSAIFTLMLRLVPSRRAVVTGHVSPELPGYS